MIKYQKITDISLVTDTISKNPYLKSRYDTNTDIFSSAIHQRYFRCIDPPLVYAVVIGRQRPREPRLHTLHGYNPGASCISSPSQLNRYFVCILEAGGY